MQVQHRGSNDSLCQTIALEPDLKCIVCFQSLVFVSPAGEAAAVMLEHHKGGSTHLGANTRLPKGELVGRPCGVNAPRRCSGIAFGAFPGEGTLLTR